jgi:hypothetical protein
LNRRGGPDDNPLGHPKRRRPPQRHREQREKEREGKRGGRAEKNKRKQ